MTPKHLIAGAASLALALAAVALAAANPNGGHTALAQLGPTQPAYTCASVHFGMSDDDLTGDAYLGPSGLGSGESVGVCHNVTMTAYSGSTAYRDPKVAESVKLASSKSAGSFTLTFEETIVGCTVYCIGWKDKSCTVSVNGATAQSVSSDSGVTGSKGSVPVTYEAHYFDLDETSTITVSAAKNRQIVVGDVSLRIKAS